MLQPYSLYHKPRRHRRNFYGQDVRPRSLQKRSKTDGASKTRDPRAKGFGVIMARGPYQGLWAICYKVKGNSAWVQFDDMRLPQHHEVKRRDVHFRYPKIKWG